MEYGKLSYSTMIRNLKSVKRNIVSMPILDLKTNTTQFKEVNIYNTTLDVDRGPNDNC